MKSQQMAKMTVSFFGILGFPVAFALIDMMIIFPFNIIFFLIGYPLVLYGIYKLMISAGRENEENLRKIRKAKKAM
jgi:predicted membrane protein